MQVRAGPGVQRHLAAVQLPEVEGGEAEEAEAAQEAQEDPGEQGQEVSGEQSESFPALI